MVHAGRAGCIAPVHFDWDHSWVAHACLTGRKRFFFFPPESGWLLSPVINTSALAIPRFSEPDRSEFLRRTGGMEVVLEAGQGVVFPSMFWHGVVYEASSLSISVRFEQVPGGRPFSALPRSPWLQRLVWHFSKSGYGAAAHGFLEDYLPVFFEKGGWMDRYRRVNAFCRRALLDAGEEHGAKELTGENFSAELALASEELRLYYGGVNKAAPAADIRETLDYLFEEIPSMPAASRSLAAYALNKRQGLRPRRGLVEIVTIEEC